MHPTFALKYEANFAKIRFNGFNTEGKLTTDKWAKICKTSQATARGDINDLIGKGYFGKRC